MFTDKTGTLTENEMHFRECSINGTKYREVNGKLLPEGMTDDAPDGSTPQLVTHIYTHHIFFLFWQSNIIHIHCLPFCCQTRTSLAYRQMMSATTFYLRLFM